MSHQVSLSASLRTAAGDQGLVEVEADTIRELLTRLVDRYPRMQQHLDDGIAVSIDGQIYRDNWSTKIPEDAEVFLLPRIQGG